MSRKKHRRNCLSLPDLGAGIVRILKKSAVNALVSKAHLVGEDSRTHSCNSVRQHTSGKFTAREYIVPYRDLLVNYLVDHALVYALVVSADNEDIVGGTNIKVIADGADEKAAVDALIELVDSGFSEESR